MNPVMTAAAPFLQASLAVGAAASFAPVRGWIAQGGLRHAVTAIGLVACVLELLRTIIHG